MIAIRPLTAEDHHQLTSLYPIGSRPQLTSLLALHRQPRASAWLAWREDQAVAAAWFSRVDSEGELLDIRVATEYRCQGIAGALLTEALRVLEDDGLTTCHLEVRAGNAPAFALYRRLGFHAVGRRAGYYPGPQGREDAVLMTRATTEQARL